MSTERFCPECGTKIAENERFCPDCGADLDDGTTSQKSADTQGNPVIGAGARTNVTGGITTNSSSNSISRTTNTLTRNTNVNTSSIDNSSTVNHNTTIVMGKDKAEYCDVCGNPLGEKHARCPKCGKQICFDCKVKNKNRCIECEKKAVNEYRVAFQQLLLTTNGNIGIAGRQMMDTKARELDVEDVKSSIEKELLELYKPAVKPVQPTVAPSQPAASHNTAPNENTGAKGVGTLTGSAPVPPRTGNSGGKSTGGNRNKWLIPVIAVVIIIAIVVVISLPKDKPAKETAVPAETEQTQPAATPQQTEQAAPAETAPAVKAQPAEKPAPKPEKDLEYEKGMAAYDKGEGLEAIGHFKASGSAESYYMLGVIYEQGCGSVGKNAMMARQNFKKAADLGNAKAKAKL